MKTLFVLLAVATVACMVSVEARPHMQKRFWWGDLIDYLKAKYLAAKQAFNDLISTIDFDAAIELLVPYIHSGMTVSACVTACTGAASVSLGPVGIVSSTVCTPLCEGALIKLEEIAG